MPVSSPLTSGVFPRPLSHTAGTLLCVTSHFQLKPRVSDSPCVTAERTIRGCERGACPALLGVLPLLPPSSLPPLSLNLFLPVPLSPAAKRKKMAVGVAEWACALFGCCFFSLIVSSLANIFEVEHSFFPRCLLLTEPT